MANDARSRQGKEPTDARTAFFLEPVRVEADWA